MGETALKTQLRAALTSLGDAGGDLGETDEMARELAELIRPYAAPGFECLMAPLPPTPPTAYRGVDGIVKAWTDFAASFQSIRAELEEVVESDEALVLLVRQHVVMHRGGVEMSQPGALVIRFAGDQVENVQFHIDQEAAKRAGGL